MTALPAFEAGWASLDDMVMVDAGTERLTDDCLGRLVRVLQQSIVAYVDDPAATNVLMSDARAQFNPLERLTAELFDEGTRLAIAAGVFDTGRPTAPGAIATADFDEFLSQLAQAMGVEPVLIDELVDERFVDATISR